MQICSGIYQAGLFLILDDGINLIFYIKKLLGIRRLISSGTVPHVAVGRKKLVNVDTLLEFLEASGKEG